MTSNLKEYLSEVNRYLYMNEDSDKEDIIREIQNYIQDETKSLYGIVNEENVQIVINKFGTAKEIANKYMNELEDTSLPNKKFFSVILGVVFVISTSIYLFMIVNGVNGFEFLESYSDSNQIILRVLSIGIILIIDLGLLLPFAIGMRGKQDNYKVARFIYSANKETNLASISFFRSRSRKNNFIQFLVSTIVLLVEGIILKKYNTLFVIASTNQENVFKADNEVCRVISMIILFTTLLHVIFYLVSMLLHKTSEGIVLSYIRFVLLWAVLNVLAFYQLNDPNIQLITEDMTYLKTVYSIVIVIFAFDSIKRSISSSIKYNLKSK